MEGMIGEIRGFGGSFAPRSWALCNGQLLAIGSNTALFSILGTTFGGDGRSSFGLPDLRGRVPVSAGTGPGLTPYSLGARGGQEYVTLNVLEIPSHFHTASAVSSGAVNAPITAQGTIMAGTAGTKTDNPTGAYLGQASPTGAKQADNYTNAASTTMAPDAVEVTGVASINMSGVTSSVTVNPTGASQSHLNVQPFLTINWIIAMLGVFPSRS